MSALETAERRLTEALARLESVVSARPSPAEVAAVQQEAQARQTAMVRDCELLRAECESLRRELTAVRERHRKLTETTGIVQDRLSSAIGEIDDLLGA